MNKLIFIIFFLNYFFVSTLVNQTQDNPQSIFEGIELGNRPKLNFAENQMETKVIQKALNSTRKKFISNDNTTIYSEFIKTKLKTKNLFKEENEYNQTYLYHKCKEFLKNYPLNNKDFLNSSLEKEIQQFGKSSNRNFFKIKTVDNIPFVALSILKNIEQQINKHYKDLKNLNITINKNEGSFMLNNDQYKFLIVKNKKKNA